MSWTTHPNSKAQRCLAVLADGPATTGEIAAETGLQSKLAGTRMALLHKRGKVQRERWVKPEGRGQRDCWLWSLA